MRFVIKKLPTGKTGRIFSAALLFFAAAGLLLWAWFQALLHRSGGESGAENYKTYSYHCAFIAEDSGDPFWNSIYEGARRAGEKRDIYVERYGDSLTLPFSAAEEMEIAIASGVDAVITEGIPGEGMEELIEKAAEKGIVTVTVYRDLPESRRQSFIGIDNLQLGYNLCARAYPYVEKESDEILVVYDEDSENTILSSGMKKFLDEREGRAVLNARMIESRETYDTQDEIRNLLQDEKTRPRVLVCTSLLQTQCASQTIVDLNCVGEIKILGFYSSESIRDAIRKDIIQGTVVVDTEKMGKAAVESISEYLTYGYASDYTSVSARIQDRSDCEEVGEE